MTFETADKLDFIWFIAGNDGYFREIFYKYTSL